MDTTPWGATAAGGMRAIVGTELTSESYIDLCDDDIDQSPYVIPFVSYDAPPKKNAEAKCPACMQFTS
jgi:hypothetical protein